MFCAFVLLMLFRFLCFKSKFCVDDHVHVLLLDFSLRFYAIVCCLICLVVIIGICV